jgi:iron complex outermembrane receptor protein
VESLRISHAMDAAELTLITSWRDWSLNPYEADFDYSPVPFVRGRFVLGQNQIAQEVRLDSRDQESGWRWRIGVFADRISSDGTEEFLFQQFTKLISFSDHNHEAAIFCRSTWDLGNGFELTAGARLEYSEESITRSRHVSFESATTNFNAARSEWNAQPRLALTYNWSREISLFIDSTYGYKSGGFSFLETDPRLAQFDMERVWLNEIGARAATSDQRFELHTLAFVNRIEDYQVERPAIPPDITIFNAPLVVSWGAELEAVARPIDNLELRGSVGYTKSEFCEFHDPFTAVSYRGNATPFTPEFTVNASARYTWRGIFLQGELLAAGETFYDEANTEDLREAPHAQLNARIGYETRHFVLTIFCENLTGERYFTQKIASANVGTPVPPRTFGGSASLKF